MRLYHFTSEKNLEQILESGCLNRSGGGVVWLTKNKELEAQEWSNGNNATVRISVSLLNISHFGRNAPPHKLVQGAVDWYTTEQPIPRKLWVDVESFQNGQWRIYKGLSYKNRKIK
jgi:hypothetical protein